MFGIPIALLITIALSFVFSIKVGVIFFVINAIPMVFLIIYETAYVFEDVFDTIKAIASKRRTKYITLR